MDLAALVTPNGLPQFGIFPAPVRRINYLDYDYRSPMGRRVGMLGKRARFRQFQYFGGMSSELMFGCAIADMRFVALAFLYVFQPSTRRIRRYSFRVPLARGVTSSLSPVSGTTSFRARGVSVEMTATDAPATKRLVARVDAGLEIDAVFSEDEPGVSADGALHTGGYQRLGVCAESGGRAARRAGAVRFRGVRPGGG